MADENLNKTIAVQSKSIDAADLPQGLPWAFVDYLVNQSGDVSNIANQANAAAGGAYAAQLTNDEQNIVLDSHAEELRRHSETLQQHQITLDDHEERIHQAELDIADHERRIAQNESDITEVKRDYLNKTETTPQEIAGPIGVKVSYSVNGVKVVGERVTGWSASTGTALSSAFNADQNYATGAAYSQTEAQAMATGLRQARQRIKALEDALRSHGLIN